MGEERQGGTEDERKSSTPDQSTALLGKERTLLRILSFLLSFLLKLSFCFPACHSRGRKFRERERNSRFHETDGKLSVRLRKSVLRDCKQDLSPSVLVSSEE